MTSEAEGMNDRQEGRHAGRAARTTPRAWGELEFRTGVTPMLTICQEDVRVRAWMFLILDGPFAIDSHLALR